ncbi:sensor histidine kinase, partial [Thermus oshimai]
RRQVDTEGSTHEEILRKTDLAQAAGRFEEAPFSPGRDEVGTLARAFADLLARLRAERARELAFLALASHELRTPIAALRAALEGLLARGGAGPRDLARLRDQALRVEELAENLLALSRAQAREVTRAWVNLAELLGSVFDRFQPLALRFGRELFLEAEPLEVEADPRLLEQALNNLVYNALIHGKGRVFLRAFPGEKGAALEVADEGEGLGLQAREGLGLRVVRAVAEALGAGLTLENAPGLRVRFTFPSARGPLLKPEPEGSGR